ncbi:MAG: DUF2017 family protein [Cumulibacter sp.]
MATDRRHFVRSDEAIEMRLREVERELLTGFFRQVRAILLERAAEVGQSGAVSAPDGDDAESLRATLEHQSSPLPPPEDPAIARLLPSGRRDFSAQAGDSAIEFRRLTEPDLRKAKLADAVRAGELVADETARMGLEDANRLLRAINDVRLSLGARLEVTEDTEYPREILTEHDQTLAIYFWTGGMQEELLEAIIEIDPQL